MANIPLYERKVSERDTLQAPKQSLDAPDSAFGGDTGKLAATAAGITGKVAAAMKQHQLKANDERNSAWVSQSMAKLAKQYDDYTFGSADGKEVGAFSVSGEAVTGLTGRARKDLKLMIAEVRKDAPSSAASNEFDIRAETLRTSTSHMVARYEAAETKQWKINSKAENVLIQSNFIEAKWTLESERIEKEFDTQIVPDLTELAKLQEVPAEALIRPRREKVYTNIINQNLAQGNTVRARELLDTWSPSEGDTDSPLSAETRVQLTSNIRKKEIDTGAESIAFTYYTQLQTESITEAKANEKINRIKDDDLKRMTRSRFNAYARQYKINERNWIAAETVDQVAELDNRAGSLPDQQQLVDNYPTDSAKQRKVKIQLEVRLKKYKSAEGMRPMTDPAAYADASDKIISGEITDEQDIDAQYSGGIEKADRDDLKKDLGIAQKANTKLLKEAYMRAAGIEGGAAASSKLKKGKKVDLGEFEMWARKVAAETNRAQEEGYIQKLADTWVMGGESKSTISWGYGTDESYGAALRDGEVDTWLPKMDNPETAKKIEAYFKKNPNIKKAMVDKYGDYDNLAVRGYYKVLLTKHGLTLKADKE